MMDSIALQVSVYLFYEHDVIYCYSLMTKSIYSVLNTMLSNKSSHTPHKGDWESGMRSIHISVLG